MDKIKRNYCSGNTAIHADRYNLHIGKGNADSCADGGGVADVQDKDPHELLKVTGVGTISAKAISDAVVRIRTSVYEQAASRINPADLSAEDIELLESIYKKR
ncbi:hypothetical protein [Oceanobacillus alkalisoli]|uniref:hypothetical protein n=1 Tax=Oceanobacillus alkalisoli TaxID=2925113 RepID=UPI001EF03EBC|nr:hypothetical protein [Oceanobacillus alkalisoli]MCF3944911.1 hypothetical protein [Oceanobacillus alkalisoli]MCG5105195.1 hypothetical protein [Oceanobacillus alkalisoli]